MITLNTPGARTVTEATPWIIDGEGVFVATTGETAQLIIGGRTVADRPAAEVETIAAAHGWAVEYLAAQDEQAAAELAGTIEHSDLTEAVVKVRAEGAEMLAEAERMAAHGEGDYVFTRSNGRKGRLNLAHPAHPVNRAEWLRKAGQRLAAWTAEDEQAYGRYIADGLADTDGYYAPQAREYWAG
jgi:hypothetical protein